MYRKIIFFSLSLALTSCFSIKKSLKEDEFLLYKQEIKGNKKISSDKLVSRFRQTSNTRFLGTYPYVWVYNIGKNLEKRRQRKDSISIEKLEQKLAQNTTDSSKIKKIEEQLSEIRMRYEADEINTYYNTMIRDVEAEYDSEIKSSTEQSKKENLSFKKEKKISKLIEKRNKKVDQLKLRQEKGNWLMRSSISEKPAILEEQLIYQTAEDMENYLTTVGFFNANVWADIQKNKTTRKAHVVYQVHENTPYFIHNLEYIIKDDTLRKIIKKRDTLNLTHQRYNRDVLLSERNSIEKHLKNKGYYNFSKEYIRILADTSVFINDTIDVPKGRFVDLQIVVENPEKIDTTKIKENTFQSNRPKVYLDNILGKHIPYQVKDVFFFTKANQNNAIDTTQTSTYSGIHYGPLSKRYSKKVLNSKITIRPGALYQSEEVNKTQRLLGSLNMFEFVNIRNEIDEKGHYNAYIVTKPSKKFSISNELGVNFNQNVPGPFINTTLVQRNPFGGLELLESSVQVNLNGQISITDTSGRYNSLEIIISSGLRFPQLILPSYRLRQHFNDWTPQTRVAVGFNFTNRPEYIQRSFNTSMSYSIQKNNKKFYDLSLVDISILSTEITAESFEQRLQDLFEFQGSNIFRSFDNTLVSSTNFYYTLNTFDAYVTHPTNYFRLFLESGGTLFNLFGQSLEGDQLFGLNYFKFVKLSANYNYYWPFNRRSMLATRLYVGAALPYGSSDALPYNKYFFSGGSNSIRAWNSRRLGPGSSANLKTGPNGEDVVDYTYESPGEIIIESNIEYRFKIWSFLNGALFTDIGNVWLWDERIPDENFRGNVQFTKDFYKELAIGIGFGFRMDFSFLILRLDLGIKAYDPAQLEGDRWVIKNINLQQPFGLPGQSNINIGIGYPF